MEITRIRMVKNKWEGGIMHRRVIIDGASGMQEYTVHSIRYSPDRGSEYLLADTKGVVVRTCYAPLHLHAYNAVKVVSGERIRYFADFGHDTEAFNPKLRCCPLTPMTQKEMQQQVALIIISKLVLTRR